VWWVVKVTSKKPTGRFHHGDLAEQAALVAGQHVAEHGHESFTLRKVAAALGVTEAALYRHYAGRESLLGEVAVRGFARFLEAMGAELSAATDAFDGAERFARTYVRFAAAHRGWFRLQFSREIADNQSGALAPRYGEAEAARQALLDALAGALPEGDPRVADLYRLVWGTAHGLAFLVVERVFQLVQTDEERIAAADEAIGLLVQSLRARRALAVVGGSVAI
jgi:AcrR family transcriptional regulator